MKHTRPLRAKWMFLARAGWLLLFLALPLLASCAGEDFTPVFFPPPEPEESTQSPAGGSDASRQCTLSFTSQLCVRIKGENLDVGGDDDDPLCAEVPAFPLHISGQTITIKGSEFPDIQVEGHGLPAPITINARGDGDGASLTSQGTIDAAGNITIENFSMFILALGIVGEVPGLTLTTQSTEALPYLDALQGSPADAAGAMTLVTATELGHVIDAADEYLMGASLTASFRGSIVPTLAECGGEAEQNIEVSKITISEEGEEIASPLPEENILEVSRGTFIAEDALDVGSRFETTTMFRVKNISTKAQTLSLPPRKGPFSFSATIPLTGSLAAQQSFILRITFRPETQNAQPGKIVESMTIGPNAFQIVATALSKSGQSSVSIVNDDGEVTRNNVDEVPLGNAAVTANAERRFFLCQEIACEEGKGLTNCQECPDPSTTPCELLSISTEGAPLAEVNASCEQLRPDAPPLLTIDLSGAGKIALTAEKQVIAIRNQGTKDLTITKIALEEVPESKSKGQFSLPPGALFVARDFSEIQHEVSAALAGQAQQGAKLPITLPPYHAGYDEMAAYIVITYTPNDLIGADGQQAGVGSKATDRALLTISTDVGDMTAEITGTTSIDEAPALELYFKTSTGTKRVENEQDFAFKGITSQTTDLAVPLFARVADTSRHSLRITSVTLGGPDATFFEWLDSKSKIDAVQPEAGKGMRCSIPVLDETTGELTDEIFDLRPVSLASPGYDIAPGAYSLETMPLLGCVSFHRDEGTQISKRLFEGTIAVEATELTEAGLPAQNPDGSAKQTALQAKLLASIDPRSGKFVIRIAQTVAAILNPQFPALSAISSRKDIMPDLLSGKIKDSDMQIFTGSMILDPFDEMTITTADGKEVVTTPNDGITAIFRNVDTHPVSENYSDDALFDYAALLYDATRGEGYRGIYEDYPNIPENARINSWRIFTTTLSYPGPLAPAEERANYPSECKVINPCDENDLQAFTESGARAEGKGACAFFYATSGRYDSPSFHTEEEMEGGTYVPLCEGVDKTQELLDANTGHYSVDGRLTFEELGLRFFGPTYFHNPGGPLGPKPALDEIFHIAFTTEMLKPQEDPSQPDVLPDKKIDLAKNEFKIFLTDEPETTAKICENNTQNRIVEGKRYSTWKYFEGLLFKDKEGLIPAGCPEADNDYNGGQAYLRGKPVDPETGALTVSTVAKFGPEDRLSFAFQNVMAFVVLNGWLCDPLGNEEELEGSRCFDITLNDRDASVQTSIVR